MLRAGDSGNVCWGRYGRGQSGEWVLPLLPPFLFIFILGVSTHYAFFSVMTGQEQDKAFRSFRAYAGCNILFQSRCCFCCSSFFFFTLFSWLFVVLIILYFVPGNLYVAIPIVGVEKERRTLIGPWWPAKAASVTGTTLTTTGFVPADSRQWTPSVRNCVTW